MFSYRHAFHAGNHADVLKHTVLLAVLRYLVQKDTALLVLDTHAGAGLYRLDGDYARTSAEAAQGYLRLVEHAPAAGWCALLQDYLDAVASFNKPGQHLVYPGSPFLMHHVLAARARDRIKLCELHPTDAKNLSGNMAQLQAGRQIAVLQEDGFDAVRKFMPPPSRRALVLCDPSYEMKADYARVAAMVDDALQRFVTGSYLVWYPIIARPEAHALPRKLKTLAQRAERPWLEVSLTLKSSRLRQDGAGETIRPGLPASGLFLINPPHTLKAGLSEALPQLVSALGQEANASFTLEAGGR